MARKAGTIQITCGLDNQAHDITDNNLIAGQRAGVYQALCGHLVSAAALATPLGRPCADCTAIWVARQQTSTAHVARRSRHRRPGPLRRILQSRRNTSTNVGVWSHTGSLASR
ncbi:MAG TPA: hypothetical protein VIY28_09895 [Pseudonocardiaceae bacterium]